MLNQISIAIADDHKIVRDGLKFFLSKVKDFNIVGEAEDGEQLLLFLENNYADVVIIDIAMPKMNGLETLKILSEQNPNIKVIMLSMHEEPDYIMKAIQNGAKGYLLKSTDEGELETAIRNVAAGGKYFNSAVSSIMIENLSHAPAIKMNSEIQISQREKEILVEVSKGLSNKMIADKLNISARTVETHRLNLLRKLGAGNTAEMIKKAIDTGLV